MTKPDFMAIVEAQCDRPDKETLIKGLLSYYGRFAGNPKSPHEVAAYTVLLGVIHSRPESLQATETLHMLMLAGAALVQAGWEEGRRYQTELLVGAEASPESGSP